jgi:hypothetical protein
MKTIIGFMSLALVLLTLACNNKPADVKKEVIVVPAAPVIIVKDPPEKSTTVTLDKNGIKVKTKKVEVSVKN